MDLTTQHPLQSETPKKQVHLALPNQSMPSDEVLHQTHGETLNRPETLTDSWLLHPD